MIDIRTYLESDLNPGGVASVADIATRVSKGSIPVKSKITDLITELNKLYSEMTPTKLPKSKDK